MSDELKPCPFCKCSYDKDDDDYFYSGNHKNWCPLRGTAYGGYGLTVPCWPDAIAAWNRRVDDAPEQPVDNGADVVAILRKYATFWGVSHVTNTQCDSDWEVTTMRALADMIERDYVRRDSIANDTPINEKHVPSFKESTEDTQVLTDNREKLLDYIWREITTTLRNNGRLHDSYFWYANIVSWLDRQASITERELCDRCSPYATARDYLDTIDSLTAERDGLRKQLAEKQRVIDVQRDSFAKMKRECAELRQMLSDAAESI